jgi:aminoglycoside phosphotransferase (APT) family kinase protein
MNDFSTVTTARALQVACAEVGLDASGAELLRLGENAMYRLHHDPVVVRIARTRAYLPDVEKEVAVARWLDSVGVPAVRLTKHSRQPLLVADTVITFWEFVPESTAPATVGDLARLLRQLHSLPVPDGVPLQPLDPFHRIPERIRGARGIHSDDRAMLWDRYEDLNDRYHTVQFELPTAVIHGDANIGNVIHHIDGRVLLLDFDNFAIGPPEWDLTLTATYYSNFRWHSEAEYRQFSDVYGYDVMQLPGYPVLRDLRELHMLSWLVQNVAENARVAAEFRKRVATIRNGIMPRGWEPF